MRYGLTCCREGAKVEPITSLVADLGRVKNVSQQGNREDYMRYGRGCATILQAQEGCTWKCKHHVEASCSQDWSKEALSAVQQHQHESCSRETYLN